MRIQVWKNLDRLGGLRVVRIDQRDRAVRCVSSEQHRIVRGQREPDELDLAGERRTYGEKLVCARKSVNVSFPKMEAIRMRDGQKI